jgi:type II secretory pathway component PulM
MIVRYLMRRTRRERWMLGAVGLGLAAVACYVAAVSPARRAVADHEQQLLSTEANLNLQQRQLTLLRAETAAARKSLDRLAGASPPWGTAAETDALLQKWQRAAEEVGLELESVSRERQTSVTGDTGPVSVTVVTVRLEVRGPYANVMALLGRLREGPQAVGLESLDIQVAETTPFDLRATLAIRLGVVGEETTREGV